MSEKIVITDTDAVFSSCEKYRYRLWRYWDKSKKHAVFIMLNPSTADWTKNDPTVERCQRRAQAMGYGGIEVLNVFALRSTDPRALKKADDPIGPRNDWEIRKVVVHDGVGIIICGWGTHISGSGRSEEIRRILTEAGVRAFSLGLTKGGEPKHPLYIGYDVTPERFVY